MEILFFVSGCIQLFDQINQNYGDNGQITFKHILEYYFNYIKHQSDNVSFILNENHKISNIIPKQDNVLENFFFKAPQLVRENSLNYISLKIDSLKSNPKAFKNTVKVCLYSPKMEIFLISLDGHWVLQIFDKKAQLCMELLPQSHLKNSPISLISIAINEKQQRVACLLSDNSVSFWDFPLLDFELNCKLKYFLVPLQIIFSTSYNNFCLVYENFYILPFDPTDDSLDGFFIKNNDGSQLTELLEIETLKLFFIMTKEKEFFIFDTKKNMIILSKKLQLKNTQKIIYSQKFHVLFIITHDTNIPVFKLDYVNQTFELIFIGWLIGHLSQVVGAVFYEDLGVLISIDEKVHLKFWDVWKMSCIKSVEIQGKSYIKNLLLIQQTRQLVLISKKINLYELEFDVNSDQHDQKKDTILYVHIEKTINKIMVFCPWKLFQIDCFTGRLEQIIDYDQFQIQNKKQMEATFISIIEEKKKILMGDNKGNIFILNMDFKLICSLQNHSYPIIRVFFLSEQNIFVSVCTNEIKIQYLQGDLNNKSDIQVLRRLKDILKGGYNIQQIELNFEMNLLLMSDGSNEIMIIDFEFGRIHGVMKTYDETSILFFKLFSPLGLIIVYTSDHRIKIVEYQFDMFHSGLKMSLTTHVSQQQPVFNQYGNLSHMELFSDTLNQSNQVAENILILAYESGTIVFFKLICHKIKLKKQYQKKNSFNLRRTFNGNFQSEQKQNFKIYILNAWTEIQNESNIIQDNYKGSYLILENSIDTFGHDIKYFNTYYLNKQPQIIVSSKSLPLHFKIITFQGEELISFDLSQIVPEKWNFNPLEKEIIKDHLIEALQMVTKIQQNQNRKTSYFFLKHVIEQNNEFVKNPQKQLMSSEFISWEEKKKLIGENLLQHNQRQKLQRDYRLRKQKSSGYMDLQVQENKDEVFVMKNFRQNYSLKKIESLKGVPNRERLEKIFLASKVPEDQQQDDQVCKLYLWKIKKEDYNSRSLVNNVQKKNYPKIENLFSPKKYKINLQNLKKDPDLKELERKIQQNILDIKKTKKKLQSQLNKENKENSSKKGFENHQDTIKSQKFIKKFITNLNHDLNRAKNKSYAFANN